MVLAGLVVSVLNRDSGGTNYTSVNITNNSASNVSAVANKAKLSVVCVHSGYPSTGEDSSYQGFFNMRTKGAGVIFEDDKENGSAYIVTCYHVIKGNTSSVYILLYDSFVPIKASTVYYSQIYDIAVLRVTNSNEYKTSSATPAETADSSISVEGDMAVAIGNPLSSGISVTEGTVSKTTDLVRVEQITQRVIRTSAAINSGNSGGGLFDADGKLIGIVSAKNGESGVEGMGFAIPSSVVYGIVQNIMAQEATSTTSVSVEKCVLGISISISDSSAYYDEESQSAVIRETVTVASVTSGSASDGKLKEGDVLVSIRINGQLYAIDRSYVLSDLLFLCEVGDTVEINFTRNGVAMSTNITFTQTQTIH